MKINSIKMKILQIALLIVFVSCGNKSGGNKDKPKEKDNSSKQTSHISSLDNYNIEDLNPKIIKLPGDIQEISGITFTGDDRLFAHGDEDADIFEIDYNTGGIIKKFYLGSILVVKGDFEDIAFANDRFYLVESKGKLYEFTEGENNKSVEYITHKTGLNSKNNVEGLCFDSGTNTLLLACKDLGAEGLGKDKAVYSFSLNDNIFNDIPRFVIPQKEIKNNTAEGKFNPSGISRNPLSGTFYIIAAKGNTIVELSKGGEILNQKDLPESVHRQAEGIAFKKDGTLFISNEGRGKTPNIVIYEMKK
jgi:uncharacterized protein YjiK